MDLGIKNRVALIMASSSGLGKSIARRFLMEGATVMMASRNEEMLNRAVQELTDDTSVTPYYTVCDITKGKQIKNLIRSTTEKLGPISILVNNAGGPPAGTFDTFDDEAWQKAFELNLLSYIRTTREVLPFMKVQKWGRIVNSTSSSVKQVIENLILSNTLRLGVIGLTKTLSQELAPYNILINAIGPGRFDTQRIRQLDQALAVKRGVSADEISREAMNQIPLGRYGHPDEYARLAVFLCSEANSYITGQTILADGGMVKAVL